MECIKIDWGDIRTRRQDLNYITVDNALKNNLSLEKIINKNALEKVLKYTDLTEEQLLEECKDNKLVRKLVVMHISKKSTRQGTKDEEYQLQICD